MKTSTDSSDSHPLRPSLPMPLWLQGILELLLAATYAFLTVFVLLVAVWFAGGFDDQNLGNVIDLSAHIWQLIHGVPLNLNIPPSGGFTAVSGTISLIPLGLTLIPLGFCFRSGRRLARASYEGEFWVPTVAGVLTYALISAAMSLTTSTSAVSTNPLLAALIPCWVVLLGLVGGGWYESRSMARMIGVNAAQWVSKFSQYSRWTGSYVWAVVRSSLVAFLGFIAGGALLFTLTVVYNWNDILALYQSLHAGGIGDTAITLLQLGFVPNLVVWAMAWSSGAGFSFGENTVANLQTSNLGALPNLPILGAIPFPIQPYSYLALLVPLIAGVLAGWWFFRAGENHLDEWFSLKVRLRWISWPISTLCLAIFVGFLGGIWTALLGWSSRGSLGVGRFTDIGANPLYFGLLSALWIALGVVVGSVLAPLVEKDSGVELERFADTEANTGTESSSETNDESSAVIKLPQTKGKTGTESIGGVDSKEDEHADKHSNKDTETETDHREEVRTSNPRKPQLSRGRVIRRPQSKKRSVSEKKTE